MALGWLTNVRLALSPSLRQLCPLIFGLTLIAVWGLLVRGLGVPLVILPPPSAIWAQLVANPGLLWADFV